MSRLVERICVVVVAVIVGLSLAACESSVEVVEAPAPPDPATELGPLTDAFIGVWNSQDYDQLDTLLAADYQRVAPDQNAEGIEAMKAFMMQAHAAYSDFKIVVEESAYGENRAFFLWTATGTYAPEGSEGMTVKTPGITLLRFADGKITHEIVHYDTAGLMEQLGAAKVPHTE